MFASLLSFYRRFESVKNYPVAYASAVITVILSTLLIALSYFAVRKGIDIGVDLTWSRTMSIGLPVSIAFYLSHAVLVSKNDYWRKLLVDFDSESSTFRLWASLSTIVAVGGSMFWMLFEMFRG